jgi:hypothetical protein
VPLLRLGDEDVELSFAQTWAERQPAELVAEEGDGTEGAMQGQVGQSPEGGPSGVSIVCCCTRAEGPLARGSRHASSDQATV